MIKIIISMSLYIKNAITFKEIKNNNTSEIKNILQLIITI